MANDTASLEHPTVEDGWSQTVEVSVTSLANAGAEPWNPDVETDLNAVDEVEVLGAQTDSSYAITWNYTAGQFEVVNVADGTDVAASTDIGSFKVRVSGER